MTKITKFEIIKISSALFLLIFSIIILSIEYGFNFAILSILLPWSFYILCFPARHGTIILKIPAKLIFNKEIKYPEFFMWIFAILLNILVYNIYRNFYLTTTVNHLLLRIISMPWPLWIIIFVTAITNFYNLFFGLENIRKNKIKHLVIKFFLYLLSLSVFFYLIYQELVIILNIRAS